MSQDPGTAGDRAQQHNPFAAPAPPAAGPELGQDPLHVQGAYPQAPAYTQPLPYGSVPTYGRPGDSQFPTYGQPGYGQVPTYGAPGYGYPPAGGPAFAPPAGWDPPRTDSMAIAALVVAISGFLLIVTFPVGLGLGIAALVRTRRRQLGGRGLAVGAIAVGAFGTVVVIGGIVLSLVLAARSGSFSGSGTSSGTSGASGVALPEYRLVQGLTPGECLQGDPTSWSLDDAVPVSCTALHDMEVVQVYQLAERPADDTGNRGRGVRSAESTCREDVLAANSSLLGNDDWSAVYAPHPDQWDAGQTSAYCMWVSGSGVRGSATQGFGAQSSAL